ncbi:MAG: hypothetical protein HYX27_20510 [Acidobacteria bacterium]|nr:hypothetical protein [Acidobacteriota bacterium]
MEEFYVGYHPQAPPRTGRYVRLLVINLLVAVLLLAAGLVYSQRRFARSRFEFGNVKAHEGWVDLKPWPALVEGDGRSLWLVGAGKRGAGPVPSGRVRVQGSLIERDGVRMLEIASVSALDGPAGELAEKDLGSATVTGELVDTKCHLGVMNPGDGKVHRDCAIRCLRGGVPAAMRTRDGHLYFLDGKFPLAPAEPLTLRGRLVQRGDRFLLRLE